MVHISLLSKDNYVERIAINERCLFFFRESIKRKRQVSKWILPKGK